MDEAFPVLPMDDKGAQKQAEELVKKLNPDDKPNVERVLNTKGRRTRSVAIRVKRDALCCPLWARPSIVARASVTPH